MFSIRQSNVSMTETLAPKLWWFIKTQDSKDRYKTDIRFNGIIQRQDNAYFILNQKCWVSTILLTIMFASMSEPTNIVDKSLSAILETWTAIKFTKKKKKKWMHSKFTFTLTIIYQMLSRVIALMPFESKLWIFISFSYKKKLSSWYRLSSKLKFKFIFGCHHHQ